MAATKDVPGQEIETQACVVYDKRTGAVIHTHTFVPAEPGGRIEPKALVGAALEAVASHADREHLAAKVVPPSTFTPGARYRVDQETEAVEVEAESPALSPADVERSEGTSE